MSGTEMRALVGQDPLLASFKLPAKQTRRRLALGADGDERTLVNEIHEFSDTLQTTLVPQFDELTDRLQTSLEGFNSQIEQLRLVHEQSRDMVAQFEKEVKESKVDMDEQLERLRDWKSPGERVEQMQSRFNELREVLANSKTRLMHLDSMIRAAERRDNSRELRLKVVGRSFLALIAAIIAILWYAWST